MTAPAYEVYPVDFENGRWAVPYEQLKGLAVGDMLIISTPGDIVVRATVVDHHAEHGWPIVESWDESQ